MHTITINIFVDMFRDIRKNSFRLPKIGRVILKILDKHCQARDDYDDQTVHA